MLRGSPVLLEPPYHPQFFLLVGEIVGIKISRMNSTQQDPPIIHTSTGLIKTERISSRRWMYLLNKLTQWPEAVANFNGCYQWITILRMNSTLFRMGRTSGIKEIAQWCWNLQSSVFSTRRRCTKKIEIVFATNSQSKTRCTTIMYSMEKESKQMYRTF